jgi:phage regulator Rha-like protein
MNGLVTKDLTTTSEIIAKHIGVEHATTIKLVRRHLQDLQEVGQVRFEIRAGYQGAIVEIAILDDYAAMLLITHMRSIGVVKDFKRQLVIEFKRMREFIRNQSTRELEKFQAVLTQQAEEIELFAKREPRDSSSLAVILDKPTRQVQIDHDLLERHGYLTSKDYYQKYTVKTPTAKLGNLCIGRKHNTLLYDPKIKELVRLLHETESLFS